MEINQTNTTEEETEVTEASHFSLNPNLSIEKYFCLAVLCLVTACAIFGNLYILICIVGHSALQRPGHLFLASLAVTDFTLGITVMIPRLADELLGGWHFGHLLCQVQTTRNNF